MNLWPVRLLALVALAAALAACRPYISPSPDVPSSSPSPELAAVADVWEPSDEWLELYERDLEVRDLLAQSLDEEDRDRQLELYDDYREAKLDLEDYLVRNPGADAPCATLYRFAPVEMWPEPEECLNENGDY